MTVHEINDFESSSIVNSSTNIKQIINEDSAQPTESFMESLPGYELVYIAVKMFAVLFEALKLTVYVYAPLVKYGVPEQMALMFQTIVTFLEGVFIFQVWRKFKMEN